MHSVRLALCGTLTGLLACLSSPLQAQLQDARLADYEQWRLAKARSVADPQSITTLPEFQVELVHVARPEEGSWVSVVFDPQGRLVIGREDKGILRLTLSEDRQRVARSEMIDDTLLECRGLLFAHDSLYAHANNSKGLYRLRDTDGDDQFDKVELLRKTEGGVGHGRNGLALGPDGRIYLALGNNVQVPKDVSPTSPYRNYGIDRLLPCAWNEFLFDADVVPPCGHIVRTDPEGKSWELYAGGFRNPYGIAFNRDGELFTYDADMEWDAGAPWYRPTTVLHVIAGGEYGWRQETNCWPAWYPDSIPRVVDIGLGSPTGVKFGHDSHFPRKYQDAFYVLDWAYGRIIAVHLEPRQSGYTGTAETFLKGRPLNVTDLAFGPDGAMYFIVGGRRTQAALYRVSFTGERQPPLGPPENQSVEQLMRNSKTPEGWRWARKNLEYTLFQEVPPWAEGPAREFFLKPKDYSFYRVFLKDDRQFDNLQRHLARIALERLPIENWQGIAVSEGAFPQAAVRALLALARSEPPVLAEKILARLASLATETLSDDVRLELLRAVQLSLIRLGPPSTKVRDELIRALEVRYTPKAAASERQMTCEILVALAAPRVIGLTLDLLDAAPDQEEQLFYLFALRTIDHGWSIDNRKRYFAGLKRAESFAGAHYLQRFVTFIRSDALSTLTDSERQALAAQIAALGRSENAPSGPLKAARPEVAKWTLAELEPALAGLKRTADPERGRRLFAEALCGRCHRKNGSGVPVGPDLDYVASRFGRRDLLETIVVPSKVNDEKYRNLTIETSDGQVVTGQLAGGNSQKLFLAPDALEPSRIVGVPRDRIVSRTSSPVSIMPEGLLNILTAEEIQDLLAYLEGP